MKVWIAPRQKTYHVSKDCYNVRENHREVDKKVLNGKWDKCEICKENDEPA